MLKGAVSDFSQFAVTVNPPPLKKCQQMNIQNDSQTENLLKKGCSLF